ncbi:Lrp/AsnC family transcriptional regulator [Chitinophaga pinensis]|jgi:Lrp/AsnC family transcriptional regulator|uniref:Transcriptional regulator, AsnC family n=1 Tax=Chitinophaga pinensis (strain ATCC 43595 / DSM 2588 / LMG 13176 / NBRC 15968 / NCIMB 11800 / UQM 2034) TaxID=485918 RepID=A0A979G6A4_CHIPD|nr:Lrp/AsnC family transcriptional regulator [Chitinophaga pinensis]ACU61650.1 transcriptional regulator, AsnC family [Chitinophaga pinensis DSM 2588]
MEQLNKQELELLRILQKNAKFDIGDLTTRLNMSRSAIYDKIKKLENEGYIKEYVAIVDPRKVGLNFSVIISVSLNSQRLDYVQEFSRQVTALEEVADAYVTGGIFDYILRVVVKDLDAFNEFITTKLAVIPNVSKIQSSFVITNIKQSTALHF